MLGMFTHPRQAFQSIPVDIGVLDWLVPLSIIMTAFALEIMLTEDVRRNFLEQNQIELEELYPEMSTESSDLSQDSDLLPAGSSLLSLYLMSNMLGFLFIAGLLMLISSLTMNIELSFLDSWIIVIYSGTIYLLEYLIKIPLILITHQANIESGLTLFFPDSMIDTLLFQFLALFDLFSVWRVFLIGLGISVLYEISLSKTLRILYGGWILFALVFSVLVVRSGISLM